MPAAVAMRASDKSAATIAKPPLPAWDIDSKDLIIPTTVPNKPINGAEDATVPIIQVLPDNFLFN